MLFRIGHFGSNDTATEKMRQWVQTNMLSTSLPVSSFISVWSSSVVFFQRSPAATVAVPRSYCQSAFSGPCSATLPALSPFSGSQRPFPRRLPLRPKDYVSAPVERQEKCRFNRHLRNEL